MSLVNAMEMIAQNLSSHRIVDTFQVDTRPTVCQVLHTLNVGGAELLAKQFALHAAKRFRPVFLCLDELGSLGTQLRKEGIPVEVVERRPGFDRQCVRRISRFLRNQRVQLVHAHQYGPFFYCSVARLLGGDYPILFTEHGRDFPDYRRTKRVWANKVLLRKSDQIVAVGAYVRDALVENEGFSSKRVRIVYNGSEAATTYATTVNRGEVRAELELEEGNVAIVQVARLNRLKDYATAIRAMVPIAEATPQARYFIVGEGEERQAIESLIHELGLAKQVKLLGLRSDVARLLSGMDLFVLSSISEGIPLTLIEAMLAGLPCVATKVGGVPEVILDGVTGLIVESGRPYELANNVLYLIQSPETREQMGTRGRERARKVFNSARMFEEYERIYCEMTRGTVLSSSNSRG